MTLYPSRCVTVRLSDVPTAPASAPQFLGRSVAWNDLTSLDARLTRLLERAKRYRRSQDDAFCATAVWYGQRAGYEGYEGLKADVERLVGWRAEGDGPVLRSGEAYAVVYRVIYAALPDCRGDCMCQGGPWTPEPTVHGPAAVREAWMRMRPHVAPLVFERDGFACLRCGTWHDLTVDHIIPIDRGGLNRLDNFQTLCRSCNSRKGAHVDEVTC